MRTSRAGQSALLLLDVVSVLRARGIAYAVIGAMAASVHGSIRASLDADAVIAAPIQRAKSLAQDFESAGLDASLRIGDIDDPIPAMLALSDDYGNRVDLLIGLRGLDASAFTRTIPVEFMNETLQFIGREDFIAMKAFAGGPKDLQDARHALGLDRSSLDIALLKRIADGYGPDARKHLEDLLASADAG